MLPPRSSVTIANIFGIEQGMSREKLVAILGEPTGVLWNGALDWQFADGTRLIVGFDGGKATGAMQMNSPDTILDKIRRCRGLPMENT
jgi:hypothetical protein